MATPPSKNNFDVKAFLANNGQGKKSMRVRKKSRVYAQGDTCDAVFYIKKGKIKLTVVSKAGKGHNCRIESHGLLRRRALSGSAIRIGFATALTECELMRLENKAMRSALHRENKLSNMFVAYLLAPEHPIRGRFGRPTLQLQRKTIGSNTPAVSPIRQEWETRKSHS